MSELEDLKKEFEDFKAASTRSQEISATALTAHADDVRKVIETQEKDRTEFRDTLNDILLLVGGVREGFDNVLKQVKGLRKLEKKLKGFAALMGGS